MLRLVRRLAIGLAPISLAACMNPGPATAEPGATPQLALGVDLGSSVSRSLSSFSALAPGEGHERTSATSTGMKMAHEGHNDAHGAGTVNSVDPAQHKLNVSHDPIPQIGWPAMTMDFPVVPSVDLRSVKPGMRVNFTIEQGQGGMYEIRSLAPAGGGR
jgi:Cu(I)/Ag(I) efflux system periplasmic protein CusF